ncbi:MAG: hypothetical protein LBT47_11260 [Deltaproteobacteria bacterium]|jgi:hypothetical protein|nr:hypothetical protein [Deltaproteobacteria bacterium]
MLKNFPAIFLVLILFASPLFAQEETPMVSADIDIFIDLFSHDTPEEMEKAAAKYENIDDNHMKTVLMKLSMIYYFQELGLSGEKLIEEASKIDLVVTPDDLALYETKAAAIEPLLKKIVSQAAE